MTKAPLFIVVDLFCGAGGVTTGFAQAKMYVDKNGNLQSFNLAQVIACVNHDPVAIKSHWANHPEVLHFEEDIRSLDLCKGKDGQPSLEQIVKKYRKLYPDAYLILWASLECTNFSKAKGGMSRDEDSRTLAQSLYQLWDPKTKKYHDGDSYIQKLMPDYIMIENVVEFMAWGPMRIVAKKRHKDRTDLKLVKNKKTGEEEYAWSPISKKNGQDFLRWKNDITTKFGYRDEWKNMNSADFGAYTSRDRLFGCFAKGDLPMIWPEKTHAKTAKTPTVQGQPSLFGLPSRSLAPWKAVKHCLDFTDEGYSIFNRENNMAMRKQDRYDLAPASYERIYAGLVKFVAKGDDSFLSKYYSGNPDHKNISVESAAGVLTCNDHHALVTAKPFIIEAFLTKFHGNGYNRSIEDCGPAQATKDQTGVCKINWIDKNYSGSANHSSIEGPLGAQLQKDKHSVMTAECFITRDFTNGGNVRSVEEPMGAQLPVPKANLVQLDKWILDTNYRNEGTSIEQPLGVIPACRKFHYLVNPSWGVISNTSTEQPCPVLIARQDKAPLYLVAAETGTMAIPIYDTDIEIVRKIKWFMASYGISDIKMRMLRIPEMLKIQGFPPEYQLKGSQADQKKFIGNSVVPVVVKVWIEALAALVPVKRMKKRKARTQQFKQAA